jgi:hypothetical protein
MLATLPCGLVELDRDDDLREAAVSALRESNYRILRTLDCKVEAGVVYLKGELPSFYLKQIAQSVILGHVAADGVTNLIEVRKPRKPQMSSVRYEVDSTYPVHPWLTPLEA